MFKFEKEGRSPEIFVEKNIKYKLRGVALKSNI